MCRSICNPKTTLQATRCARAGSHHIAAAARVPRQLHRLRCEAARGVGPAACGDRPQRQAHALHHHHLRLRRRQQRLELAAACRQGPGVSCRRFQRPNDGDKGETARVLRAKTLVLEVRPRACLVLMLGAPQIHGRASVAEGYNLALPLAGDEPAEQPAPAQQQQPSLIACSSCACAKRPALY